MESPAPLPFSGGQPRAADWAGQEDGSGSMCTSTCVCKGLNRHYLHSCTSLMATVVTMLGTFTPVADTELTKNSKGLNPMNSAKEIVKKKITKKTLSLYLLHDSGWGEGGWEGGLGLGRSTLGLELSFFLLFLLFKSGFFSLITIDILGQITLCLAASLAFIH